jgi:hypothetical protein
MSTVQIPESEYLDLRQTMAVLERRVSHLETRFDADVEGPLPSPDLTGLQDAIVRITKELFPGEVAITSTNDPEYPQDSYTVVQAQASGETKQIEERRVQWHQRVTQLAEKCGLLRLSLDYRS